MPINNQQSSLIQVNTWTEDHKKMRKRRRNDNKKSFYWSLCLTGCVLLMIIVLSVLLALINIFFKPQFTTTTTTMISTSSSSTLTSNISLSTISSTSLVSISSASMTSGTVATTTGSTITNTSTISSSSTISSTLSTNGTMATGTGTTTMVIPSGCPVPVLVGSSNTIFSHSSSISTYTCEYIEWVSSTTDNVTLAFQFRNDANLWNLDDVSVSDGTTEMLVNGGFESGSFSPGWRRTTPNGNCTATTVGAQISSSSVHSGSFCLQDKCKSVADQISQSFTAIMGQSYFISFWIKSGGTSITVNVTLS